jgi:flagellin-like protein
MEGRCQMGNGRGISPVIATVILVAIAVSIAIAVTYWASGIAGTFSRAEKIQIDYSYIIANKNITGGATDYNITLSCRNAGSSDVTITQAFINGKPLKAFCSTSSVYMNGNLWIGSNDSDFRDFPFPVGSSLIMVIMIPGGQNQSNIIPGQVIEVRIETAGGIYYIGTFMVP